MSALVKAVISKALDPFSGTVELDPSRDYTLDELWRIAVSRDVILRVWTNDHNGSPRSVHVDAKISRRDFSAELRSKDYPPDELGAAVAEVLADPRLGIASRASR